MDGTLQQHPTHSTVAPTTWTSRTATARKADRPSLLKRVGFALVLLIPVELGAELGLRYTYFPAPPRLYRPEAGTNGGYHAMLQHADRINVDGEWVRAYRGRTFSRTKTAMFRILCLGGSTTWGHHLEAEQTWPFMLEQRLGKLGYDVEVINAGRPWYTTVHSITNYATHMRYYNPDVVVVMHGVNDLARSFPASHEPPAEWDYGSYQGPMKNVLSGYRANNRSAKRWNLNPLHLMRSTAIYRLAFDRSGSSTKPDQRLSRDDFPTLKSFRAHLDYLTRLCLDDHRAVVLATQAHVYEREDMGTLPAFDSTMRQTYMKTRSGAVADAASLRSAMRIVRNTVTDVARLRGVAVADAQQAIGSDAKYFIDDFHLNADGNAVTARTMVEVLRPMLDEMSTSNQHVDSRVLPSTSLIAQGHRELGTNP